MSYQFLLNFIQLTSESINVTRDGCIVKVFEGKVVWDENCHWIVFLEVGEKARINDGRQEAWKEWE